MKRVDLIAPLLLVLSNHAIAGGVPGAALGEEPTSPSVAGDVRKIGAIACQPSWQSISPGLPEVRGPVYAITVFDDGSGPAMYFGGNFVSAGGVAANRIAKYDGATWSALGSGMNSAVLALHAFDDGSGPALYAAGYFNTAGGVPASKIAKWNGSTWSPLGSGLNDDALCLDVFDDGSGQALFVGGYFNWAGGTTARSVARWNGASWSALGAGIDAFGYSPYVAALEVYDDGSGPALCASGLFSKAGGQPAKNLAQWNGQNWSELGGGSVYGVEALEVFDDGSGPDLYAAGNFPTMGGPSTAKGIARWNGSFWSKLGSGVGGSLWAITVFDDGSGPALFVGGKFNIAGGLSAKNVAKWDGAAWSTLGHGVSNWVFALHGFDDGSGPALFVGGDFFVSPAGDPFLAKWVGCPCRGSLATYCTALVSTSGCSPALRAAGSPILANPAGFSVAGMQLEPDRYGVLVFGTTGPSGAPFSGGTLCVQAPLYSLAIKNSGGVGTCAGSLSYTLADYLAHPSGGPLVVAGQVVNSQVWFRDPAAAQSVGLSDGLEFSVCP